MRRKTHPCPAKKEMRGRFRSGQRRSSWRSRAIAPARSRRPAFAKTQNESHLHPHIQGELRSGKGPASVQCWTISSGSDSDAGTWKLSGSRCWRVSRGSLCRLVPCELCISHQILLIMSTIYTILTKVFYCSLILVL